MTSSIRNVRHILTGTCVVGLLSGCQIFPADSDAGQIIQIAKSAFSGSPKVQLEQAAAIPYATIGIQIDDGAQGILLLASDENGKQLWTSASHIAIITAQGRITKTAGLPYNMGASYALPPQEVAQYSGTAYMADFPDLGLYGVRIVCEDKQIGAEIITLLGKPIQTIRSEERCRSDKDKLAWSFTNQFWRDPMSGFVWRSEQKINPKQGKITLEVLRPAQ